MFINYAHRGASHYAPENAMAFFYLGLFMGANNRFAQNKGQCVGAVSDYPAG